MPLNDNVILSTLTEKHFLDFFSEVYGLNIHDHQLDNLRLAINVTCISHGYLEPEALLQKIISEPFCQERLFLIEKITIDESYFFRDEFQIDFLRNDFLPKLIEHKRCSGDKQIRVWSAGCSTGQEIYSLAILLHQLLPDYDSWNLHLIGTDINYQSLNQAKEAEYNAWGIRTHTDFIKNSGYFSCIGEDRYVVNDFIKDKVKFSYLNLAEETFPSIMQGVCVLDLILCRNVFIYFEKETIKNTCAKFDESLNIGGILMLSVTDPMNMSADLFATEKCGDVFYFKKKTARFSYDEPIVEENKKRYQDNSQLLAVDKNIPQISLSDFKHSIVNAMAIADWKSALKQTENALLVSESDAELFQFKAKCLTNLGEMTNAKIACEKSIYYNAVEPHSYLLYGLILMQLGMLPDAEKAFRQTIFLNYSFMEAHYQLGQVLLYKGRKKDAIKSIQNALTIAAQEKPERPIHNVISLTYSSFSEVMRNELELIEKGIVSHE